MSRILDGKELWLVLPALLFGLSCVNGQLDGGVDAGKQGVDGGNPCARVTCGTNAECINGGCQCKPGYVGEPYDRCTAQNGTGCGASGQPCSAGSRCIDGMCQCDPGFVRDGAGNCRPRRVGDPSTRTTSQVCSIWTTGRPELSTQIWATQPSSTCSLGALDPSVHRQALGFLNSYRQLVGLDPVTTQSTYQGRAQACATALAAEGMGVTQSVSENFECYSKAAKKGAERSNIAQGIAHPARGVRLFIRDKGSRVLGHRRWLFNPSLGATGFGQRGDIACMHVVDDSGADDQSDIFYPAPGFFPIDAVHGPWSYMSKDLEITTQASVSITRVSDGAPVGVTEIWVPPKNYAKLNALAWRVPDAKPNTEYRVRMTGLGSNGSNSRVYRTTLVPCQ